MKKTITWILMVFAIINLTNAQIYLVEEGENLYFDSPKNDELKDTLGSFNEIPSYVTPLIAKSALRNNQILIHQENITKFSAFGFKQTNGVEETWITYSNNQFSPPTTKFVASLTRWNYLYIFSIPLYFLSLWMFPWFGSMKGDEDGDPSSKKIGGIILSMLIFCASGSIISWVFSVYFYPHALLPLIAMIVITIGIVLLSCKKYLKRDKSGYSNMYSFME